MQESSPAAEQRRDLPRQDCTSPHHPLLNTPHQLPGRERRVAPRRHCPGGALCHTEDDSLFAWVRDVSSTGVGLRVTGPLEPGSRLNVEFLGTAPRPRRAFPAEVVHCHAMGDGTWLVGCHFDPPLEQLA